jgi:type IV pilus assembly protein PilM
MGLFGSKKDHIGLDIEKSSIVGVQLSGQAPSASLKAYHEQPLPEGLVFEGEVVDPDGLAAELKTFMKQANMKGRLVHIGVGNQKVIVRNIETPEMSDEELRGAIEFQAQDYIPIPVADAVLDFQVVSRFSDQEGVAKQRVLLVAAQRDMVEAFTRALAKAGLKAAGIDASAFALVRALTPSVSFVDQGADGARPLGVVNISSSVSSLVVAFEGIPKFTRTISAAYDQFRRVIMEHQGIEAGDADRLIEGIGLPGPAAPDADAYSAATIEEVNSLLAGAADELADEIRRSIDYFQSQDYTAQLDKLVLTGRGALVRNIASYLGESLGIEVSVGNPLMKIGQIAGGIDAEQLAAIAPRLAVAIGLALDEGE